MFSQKSSWNKIFHPLFRLQLHWIYIYTVKKTMPSSLLEGFFLLLLEYLNKILQFCFNFIYHFVSNSVSEESIGLVWTGYTLYTGAPTKYNSENKLNFRSFVSFRDTFGKIRLYFTLKEQFNSVFKMNFLVLE